MYKLIIRVDEEGKLSKYRDKEYIEANYVKFQNFAYIHKSIYHDCMKRIDDIGFDRWCRLSYYNRESFLLECIVCVQCGKQYLTDYEEAFGHKFCSEKCIEQFQLSDEEYILFAKRFQLDSPMLFRRFYQRFKEVFKNGKKENNNTDVSEVLEENSILQKDNNELSM